MIKLGPIIEIILYVEDMESQVRFYRDVMGIALVFP
jgi:predicted enzyme related to lactoylglutathione lyase